jgi:hypothetical protein
MKCNKCTSILFYLSSCYTNVINGTMNKVRNAHYGVPNLEEIWDYITNLLNFIGLYKFCVKYVFHRFEWQLHELCVMINMNDICMYSVS